ncbi:MAG: HD domain-containing phosphohydrolase [Pseudomonadota bacterium]
MTEKREKTCNASGSRTLAADESIQSGINDFIDAFPFYVFLVDEDHYIVMANSAVEKALNLKPEAIVGKYCPAVVHGCNGPYPGCPLEEALEVDGPVEKDLYEKRMGRWLRSCIYPTSFRTVAGGRVFLHVTTDITDRKLAQEEIVRNYQVQNVINSILRLSIEKIPLEEILKYFIDQVLSVPWLSLEETGSVFLVEPGSNVLVLKAQRGLDERILKQCATVPFGKCLCGRAAMTRQVEFADHLDERHDISYDGIAPHGHYCVPLISSENLLGVLNTYVKDGHQRDSREEDFLVAAANALAGIIERRQSEARLRKAMEGTIETIARVVEVRDPYTAGHQRRVADLARAIAGEMDLSKERVEGLFFAGLIHDLGKISVPSEILSKPGRLSTIEFEIIKEHSRMGYDLLKSVDFPWDIAKFVYQHHEKFDGSGYPQGLKGGEIELEARILCVADVIEAMASHRPYRPALGIDMALEEIEKRAGTFFDPDAAQSALRVFRERRYNLEP